MPLPGEIRVTKNEFQNLVYSQKIDRWYRITNDGPEGMHVSAEATSGLVSSGDLSAARTVDVYDKEVQVRASSSQPVTGTYETLG